MKRIMILGAGILQVPLIEQAKRQGFETIVVSPDKTEVGFRYADHSVYLDVRAENEILKIAREYNIDGIITDQTDIAVRTVAYVAEKMKLPGIGYKKACIFTDKYMMREKCTELGIKTLRYKLVDNIDDALDFFENLNAIAILKPVDNQGSKGVVKVSSKKELEEKFDMSVKYSISGNVLIEEFVSGREFVVEGIACNYEFQNLIFGDTHYFDIPDVFSATERIFPSDADDKLAEKLLELNEKIITGIGLKQGISHSEFIMKDNDIYLIETAARGGGVFISSDLISISTGLCTEKFLIDIATGGLEKIPEFEKQKKACCYIAMFLPVGEVVGISGIDEVRRFSYTHRDNLDGIFVGMKTRPYTDKTSRFFIIVSGDDREELQKNVDIVRNSIDIKIKTESGIEGPIWR